MSSHAVFSTAACDEAPWSAAASQDQAAAAPLQTGQGSETLAPFQLLPFPRFSSMSSAAASYSSDNHVEVA